MQPTKQQSNSSTNNTLWLIIGGCLVAAIAAVCAFGVLATGVIVWLRYDQQVNRGIEATAVAVMPAPPTVAVIPTATYPPSQPTDQPGDPPASEPTPLPVPGVIPPDAINQTAVSGRSQRDLQTLLDTNYPPHDYFETSQRLMSNKNDERTIHTPTYQLGDQQTFVTDDGRIQATLLGLTDHAYFWVEDSLDYSQQDVQAAADRLETEFYPRLVNLFGQEWQPGVDNDPHFTILHLSGASNNSELGYFSSVDEYPRSLYSDSNQQEMVYLIMGNLELGEDLYYGTLVHEIQHLIQWYVDPNEATWLNEGLSQLAEIYLGFDTATPIDYTRRPETQLNTWDYESDYVDAHYSAAYLYSVYLWEQLGEQAIQELSRHPANGLAGVNAILQGYAPDRSLADFTADWAAANFLDDPAAGPRYNYDSLDLGRPSFDWRIKQLPQAATSELDQFGVHYIDLDFRGPVNITFAGDTMTQLIDSAPTSGEQMWYAPAQDETDARLTAVFDLTALSSATLNFTAWYDLEEEYDYAYVSVSPDGGQSWELLTPYHAVAGEYGPGFNGRSDATKDHQNGWIKEQISLNRFVGQQVMVRFDVLTDSAVSGRGFALDDIAIPELGYADDVESSRPEWAADGFVQVGWQLPQLWAVELIEGGPAPTVTRLPLNELNQGQWSVEIGKGGGTLAIIPLTPFVAQPANYWLTLDRE
ncbi:MAG: immune inhibitor A [Ardenticatenaceae bacterium]|nr:immune inhibitor A [Ardenticatenaceae bacterium]